MQHRMIRKRNHGDEGEEVLRKLREFLDEEEPKLVYWLQNNWKHQANAITYRELRTAILMGYLDQGLIEEWQKDYAKLVDKHLRPIWEKAIEQAAAEIQAKHPGFYFDPAADGVREWVDNKAAAFVTNTPQEQMKAINAVVKRAAVLQDMTVDGLARAIRPMVGLTLIQARANLKYYTAMVESGLSEKKALEKSIIYSARQNRARGYTIARTELAFSYNKGAQFGVEQAIERGYMSSQTKKIWCTADDERVCEVCGGLEGKTIAMYDDFGYKTKLERTNPGIKRTPPAHPNCRCSVLYVDDGEPGFEQWVRMQARSLLDL